jgi:hypothetical protein
MSTYRYSEHALLLPVDSARYLDASASSSLQAAGSQLAHNSVSRCFSICYDFRISRLFHSIRLHLLNPFCLEVSDE